MCMRNDTWDNRRRCLTRQNKEPISSGVNSINPNAINYPTEQIAKKRIGIFAGCPYNFQRFYCIVTSLLWFITIAREYPSYSRLSRHMRSIRTQNEWIDQLHVVNKKSPDLLSLLSVVTLPANWRVEIADLRGDSLPPGFQESMKREANALVKPWKLCSSNRNNFLAPLKKKTCWTNKNHIKDIFMEKWYICSSPNK